MLYDLVSILSCYVNAFCLRGVVDELWNKAVLEGLRLLFLGLYVIIRIVSLKFSWGEI